MFIVDTRKPDCQIKILYTLDSLVTEPIHASALHLQPWNSTRPQTPLAVISMTEHSVYSGGAAHQSNYRVLAKQFPDLIHLYGSYGYKALAYDATLGPVPVSEDLCEILEGLQDYPIVDEEDEGYLESELEDAAWDGHGRDDFKRAIVGVLDTLDDAGVEAGHEHEIPDDDAPLPSDLIADTGAWAYAATWGEFWWELWRAGCDELNVNGGSGFSVETGGLVHYYINDWCAKAGKDRRYATDKPIHGVLRKVAVACRATITRPGPGHCPNSSSSS